MRSIIYHVATSVDGFIAGPGATPAETIAGFAASGPHVDEYLRELQEYDTVIMGRRTYEFGYAFGLEAGRAAYPHMQNYVFSRTMPEPESQDDQFFLVRDAPDESGDGLDRVRELRESRGSAIYLCGGGAFAGTLLRAGLIDRIKLKISPVVLGSGVRLFEFTDARPIGDSRALKLIASKNYENGVALQTYSVDASD